ncbi:hypothetical protein HN51_053787 [Arachis hypogaea]
MWSVSSILTGLLSFMMDNSPTTSAEKQCLAKSSLFFNCKKYLRQGSNLVLELDFVARIPGSL